MAPAPAPYPAAGMRPSSNNLLGLYPCSTRFCTKVWATSWAASAPPVILALCTRLFRPAISGLPNFSVNFSTFLKRLSTRTNGTTSVRPTGVTFLMASLRTSSLTPAALARSLPSPAWVAMPIKPPRPRPAAPAIPTGATAVAAAAGAKNAPTEPNALPIP